MKPRSKKNNRIARQLIGGVVIFSLLLTVITTLTQSYRDYSHARIMIDESLADIGNSNVPSITEALWVNDDAQIQAQLDGLVRQDDIDYADILEEGHASWKSGVPDESTGISTEFSLEHEYRNEKRLIGTLRIHASLATVRSDLIDNALQKFLWNGLVTFLLAAFIIVIFHYLISRHLYAMLRGVQQFRLHSAHVDLKLEKRSDENDPDELDQLVNAFNKMQTDTTLAYQELLSEKEKSQLTLASIGDGVIVADKAGLITSINPVAAKLTEWPESAAVGKPVSEVFQIIDEITRQPAPDPVGLAMKKGILPREDKQHSMLVSRSGTETGIEESVAPIIDHDGEVLGAILVFHDVTQSRNLSRELSWQASHDSLTGLVNRREFERQLGDAIVRVEMRNESHILLFLDLDQFKIVNDSCGHHAGDELLKQISALLESRLRKSDTLGRLGGDEFGVLLLECGSNKGKGIAEDLRKIVEDYRFVWDKKTFRIGTSIGLVEIAEKASIKDYMRFADLACYEAKDSGRNRIHVYQEEEGEVKQSELLWINRITEAFEKNRFLLYVQPIVSGSDLTVHHHEVLLRMTLADGSMVPPNMFIPPAERYGIMPNIDRWVIRKSFEWLQQQAEHSPCLAINLSGASLGDKMLPEFISQMFETYQVRGKQVCFEITETTAIANLSQALTMINQLKALDCTFALDDFGSGLSSFGYLKSLPVDYLKIDGSFVRDMVDDPVDHAMVQAIHQVGRVMGIETIAEYVENSSVIDSCQQLGIDFLQGYGVGKPAPISELVLDKAKLLKASHN